MMKSRNRLPNVIAVKSKMDSGYRESMTEARWKNVGRGDGVGEGRGSSNDAPRVEEVRLQGNSATCNHGRRHTWRTEIVLCSRPSFIRRGPPFPIIIRRCHTSDVLCLPASSVPHVCQLMDDRARFEVRHSNQVNCLRESRQHRMQ